MRYEQFLGKVINLTAGHRAVVEDKPEVKKAGGVFYTPSYIVDYIVKQTVGPLIEGKSPKQIDSIRVLDPACGSGSFLIVVYQFLLDWYHQFYISHDPEKLAKGKSPVLVQARGGGWALTTAERKRILLAHVFGVDIDSQAVEVTKLSLLLKVLEGETTQSVQRELIHQRVLPDLGNNIKCGNSLIGSDFYAQPGLPEMDADAHLRVNVFDWDGKGGFPEIMKVGGFDAVVGNPPYVLLQGELRDNAQLSYLNDWYSVATYKLDTYHLFIERGSKLLGKVGRLGYITPSNFLTNNGLANLRKFILKATQPDHVLVFTGQVFDGASVDTAVTILVNSDRGAQRSFPLLQAAAGQSLTVPPSPLSIVDPKVVNADELRLFTGSSSVLAKQLWNKCEVSSANLGTLAYVNFGKQLRDRKKFTEDVVEVDTKSKVPSTHTPCFTGKNVNRYTLEWSGLTCLDDEVARSGGCWDRARHEAKGKLLTRQIGKTPVFAIDERGWHCLNTIFMVSPFTANPHFILGLLNSRLLGFLWLERFYDKRDTFPKIKGTYLKLLPIRVIDSFDNLAIAAHDRIVALVEKMLDLHKQRASLKTPHEQTALDRQIAATDTQIDHLVYELYGLTEDEIKLVEEV